MWKLTKEAFVRQGLNAESAEPIGFVKGGALSVGAFGRPDISQLKRKSVRGGLAILTAQVLKFGLQTGSTMILARLLSPRDFGLQGMVVAMIGFLALFKEAGLGTATVQRDEITQEQLSTLFWINVGVGAGLAILAASLSPALVLFFHEPRLYWVTIVSATAFVFSGMGAQHGALLQRSMRYTSIAKIDLLSLALSSALAVIMAARGWGYWALIAMAVSSSLISAVGSWIAMPWLPGKPVRRCGIRSMLHFGGTVTCNSLVVYLGYNAEKILLARSWGAAALGVYGRAYQLLNLPLQQLYSSMYTVTFSGLARIQNDPERLRRSFLKGYSVLLSLTIPVTLASALFADEIIRIVLGPKWIEAVPILRLLTPTVLAFAVLNPFGWFLFATGRAGRSLKMALVIAPTVVLGIIAGLHQGPKGVATGYSTAMTLLILPLIAWAIHGTGITMRAFWQATKRPCLAGLVAIAVGFVFKTSLGSILTPLSCLVFGLSVVGFTYAFMLLIILKQKETYMELVDQILKRVRPEQEAIKSH